MKLGLRKFNIEYTANFRSDKKEKIRIWLSEPQSSIYQKIDSFKFSEKPQSSHREGAGNKIYYFNLRSVKNLIFKIKMKAILKNNNLKLNNKTLNPIKNIKILNEFTKSEKFLEQTDEIKKLTKKITKKDRFALDKIITISEFLKKNFKYVSPVKKRGVKNLNLNKLKGDCGEAGALFVTMCRVLKIPAINKTGYVVYYNELNNIYEHGWTSVYLNGMGWIDVDPLADNIKKTKNGYIYEQKNYFLAIVNGFNINIKPVIPKNHKIDYWRKLGLPITKKSTQILQPLMFSSPIRTKLEEKIKIIK